MHSLAILVASLVTLAPPQDGPAIVVPETNRVDGARPTLAVRIDGAILAGSRVLQAPGTDAPESADLLRFLADAAQRMPKERADELGVMVPSGPLTVRADANAPFSSVARILHAASHRGVGITTIEFPVRLSGGVEEQDVVVYESLPEVLGNAWFERELPPVLDARLSVRAAGRKLRPGGTAPWDGAQGARFDYGSDRRLEVSFDSFATDDLERAQSRLVDWSDRHPEVEILRLSVGEGVTFGEVLRFYQDAARAFLVDLSA